MHAAKMSVCSAHASPHQLSPSLIFLLNFSSSPICHLANKGASFVISATSAGPHGKFEGDPDRQDAANGMRLPALPLSPFLTHSMPCPFLLVPLPSAVGIQIRNSTS